MQRSAGFILIIGILSLALASCGGQTSAATTARLAQTPCFKRPFKELVRLRTENMDHRPSPELLRWQLLARKKFQPFQRAPLAVPCPGDRGGSGFLSWIPFPSTMV